MKLRTTLFFVIVVFLWLIVNLTTSFAQTVVSVQPAEVPSPAVGGQLTVNIDITGGIGVAGYQATVNFDPTALRYVSIRNADYLPAGAFMAPVDTTDSSVRIHTTAIGGSTNGDGTLATVTFQVVEVKTSALRLTDVILSDITGQPLAVTTADGIVTGQATPPSTDVYMYWASWNLGSIQRAKLDGTNLQNVVTGLTWPRDVALNIAGNKMYWVDPGAYKVQRANLDGSNVENLVNTQGQPFGVAIDVMNGKLYWSTWNPGKIRRANLDGTNVEDFVTGLSEPEDIDLDLSGGKIYWTDTVTNKIQRANLDGSNTEDLVTVGLSHPLEMVLDVAGGKMYWTNTSFHPGPWPGLDKIQRANLDGTNVEDLVTTGLVLATGIDLDLSDGKMYWTDTVLNKIQRANLDGSSIEDVIVSSANALINPSGLALGIPQVPAGLRFDPNMIADQRFTVDILVGMTLPIAVGGTAPYTYSISALPAGLYFDHATRQIRGTPTTVVSAHPVTYTVRDAAGQTASLTFTITVQTTYGTNVYMYWSDDGTNTKKIQRANLNGTNIQDLVTTGLEGPESIALDLAAGKIYWTDTGTGKIQRANLDGTHVEDIPIIGVAAPEGIALDLAAGKIYWSDNGANRIRRANLDGSSAEDLVVTGVDYPEGLALDLAAGKIYWTEYEMAKIRRANLDGTNAEDVIATGLRNPDGIAVDTTSGKIYWTDHGTATISRADSNGTNVEALVTTGLDNPDGIALDVVAGKMYWTDWETNKIQRANLDGSHVEDLITTGLENPKRIALGIPQVAAGLRFDPDTIADQTFTVGTAVSLTLPTAIGGTPPYIYTLAPTLPAGLYFDPIANGPGSIGGIPTAVISATPFTYTATDTNGASAALTFTITVEAGGLNLDVNGDGKVDVLDLVWVAVSYGMRGTNLPADVNGDGVVNIPDLVAVAGGIDASEVLPVKIAEAVLFAAEAAAVELEGVAGAPVMGFSTSEQGFAADVVYSNVADALADARSLASRDVRLGKWMPLLEELLQVLAEIGAIPDTTALLPNYPNPFNPETWIPYHLAQDAEVVLTIYDVRGSVVRELSLGHQLAGVYESRGRAVYWDGKNYIGEKVASGLYFYTLTAGEFTATRKLLIAK